jgi:hypothetical protein
MSSEQQQRLEREVKHILDQAGSQLRLWNNADEGSRWSRVGSVIQKAEQDILRKIRELWPTSEG